MPPDVLPHEHLLQWRPKHWWDPVPDWIRDHLTVEIARELTRVQLNKYQQMLEVEQRAVKETMEILAKIG